MRECQEEAGIQVLMKGILKIEHFSSFGNNRRMLVIYYGEPHDCDAVPKTEADEDSMEAKWVTLKEFEKLDKIRGNHLIKYGNKIEKGQPIYPLSLVDEGKAMKSDPRVMRLKNGKLEYI